jgi:lipoprotein-releasing system permease protein
VYLIDHLPSLPLASDVVPVALVSLALSLAATLYPSWRASRMQPAQALRDE